MGDGDPERDWYGPPFIPAMVVFISRFGEVPRPKTRLELTGGAPFRDPLVKSASAIIATNFTDYLKAIASNQKIFYSIRLI